MSEGEGIGFGIKCKAFTRRLTAMKVEQTFPDGILLDREGVDWKEAVWEKILDAIIYTACEYIEWGRSSEKVVSKLEMEYTDHPDYETLEDEGEVRQLMESLREPDDHGLILHCIRYYDRIEHKRFKLQIMHLLNSLALAQRYQFL